VSRPPATISVDVDPVDLHLLGYGFRHLDPDYLVYDAALPRLVESFARHGVTATLFVVGRDAAARPEALRSASAANHEIASHSLTHPLGLASLDEGALTIEFEGSRQVLERAVDRPVVGFRAPNFDMNLRTLRSLASHGYRYDASAYPTPVLIAARLVLAMKSGNPLDVLKLTPWPFTWRRGVHEVRFGGTGDLRLTQFPVSVTPGIRFPVYHTLRYGMSDARFESLLDGFVSRGEGLSYVMHAVDALGFAEDHVDSRLAKHPGIRVSLERKLDLLERTLAAIARRFEPLSFRDRLTAP
jgi:hypothetical protein